MSISDDEMSQVLEALRTAEFPTVDVTMNDRFQPVIMELSPEYRAALLADIRAIVRSELGNLRELHDFRDALEEVLTSAPDDEDGMKEMLLDWLREVRLS